MRESAVRNRLHVSSHCDLNGLAAPPATCEARVPVSIRWQPGSRQTALCAPLRIAGTLPDSSVALITWPLTI